jgi:hypothetical protein
VFKILFYILGSMKEVWQEIMEGISLKPILITLLSIAIICFLCILFFTLKEKFSQTELIEKHTVSPKLNQPK